MSNFPLRKNIFSTPSLKPMNQQAIYSDTDIIDGIRQNNQRVLADVYKKYYQMIVHLILQNSGTEQDAKDIYQEAMMIFFEKIQQENFMLTCQVKTFVYSICRRLWLKRLKEKSRYVGKIDDFEEFIPFEKNDLNEEDNEKRFEIAEESLSLLGEPCNTILIDFYINHFSMQQITDKMGYTNAENAKTQKYKCLQRLKKLFFERYKNVEH
jgi:RNA polymerase sigma factor (sigma-70 family)